MYVPIILRSPFYSPRLPGQDSNGDPILDRSRYQLNVNRRQGEMAPAQEATPKYGPDDFITEIVRLDKNALDKYFPDSPVKPLVLGADTVTSSSVKVRCRIDQRDGGWRQSTEKLRKLCKRLREILLV